MRVTPGEVLDPPVTRLCSVLPAMTGAGAVARQHVDDVLRISSLAEPVVDLAGMLVQQTVERLTASTQGSIDLAVEVTPATVTVTVTGRGHGLFDGFLLDPSGSGSGVGPELTSGVREQDGMTSAWFSVVVDGVRPARLQPEEAQTRLRTLVGLTSALAGADTLGAVSDGVTAAIRAYLGAAFTGLALPDPLAARTVRYVSMDPLPEETARDWHEIPLDGTSPVSAAIVRRRPTYFSSRAAADHAFPGIGEHMRTAGVSSMAHVPLSVGGELVGTLAVSWAREHVVEVEEQALLATVAAYAAIAVARERASAGDSAAPVRAAGPPSTAPGALRPLRVLIVDDTADIRELLTALFARRSDVEVVAAARDGLEGIELAAALQPDIVVLDVAMPVLDGISALPRLVAAAPHARVVMLSALPAELRASVALAAGAMAYVEKTTAVASLVDDLLEGAKLLDVAVRRLTEQIDQQLEADPRQIRLARHLVADTLDRWKQSPLADTVVLLLSELVTNAVLHARSAPRVSVRLLPDRVHVEVTDQDPEDLHAHPATSDATSGRGLAIVEALALGWGTAMLPRGKVVWFDVARES